MTLDYKKLLHLAYEIEGLLLVQMDRPERHSAELDALIADKAAMLAQLTGQGAEAAEIDDAEAIAESAIEETVEDADIPTPVPTPSPAPASAPAPEQKPQPAPEPESEPQPAPAATLDERIAREKAKDIFKAFTLNDKFRFRRELFRNSQAEFDDTLEVVSAMNSLEEAEEYFYDDLCWDPANEHVKAFMEVVAKHF